MQRWQWGVISLAMGGFFVFSAWHSYGYVPLLLTEVNMIFAFMILGIGIWNLLAPATMLTCPRCGTRTRHYRVRDKLKRRVFKCDVCGHVGVLSPPKPPRPKGFCINCGKARVTESKFCPECGANQSENGTRHV